MYDILLLTEDPVSETKQNWTFNEVDARIAEELQAKLPSRLFDAHTHLYDRSDCRPYPPFMETGPAEATRDVWQQHVERWVGAGRLKGGLALPFPAPQTSPNAADDFINKQLRK